MNCKNYYNIIVIKFYIILSIIKFINILLNLLINFRVLFFEISNFF